MISKIGNDKKTLKKRLDMLEEAFEYLDGTGDDYKVLMQMGSIQCKLARMEENAIISEKRQNEARRLFKMAMDDALGLKKMDAYLSIANTFAGNLTNYFKDPRGAISVLTEAERLLSAHPPLKPTFYTRAFLAMLDKMYGEAYKELGEYDKALKKLGSALKKSEKAGYAQGVLYCRATEAQVYLRKGDIDKAERLALYCLKYMKKQGLEDAEVRGDMQEVLDDVEKLRRGEDTAVSGPYS